MALEFDLNDLESIKRVDKENLLEAVEKLPQQCEEASSIAQKAPVVKPAQITAVAVLGMGGSGIGGDMVRALLEAELSVPITVVKGYQLPAYIGKETLVFAVSYSGETEETLSSFEEAIKRKAHIVAVTSNGELKKRALEENIPLIEVPAGYQPRAALGYLFLPILVYLARIGLAQDRTDQIKEAISVLRSESSRFARGVPVGQNDAKRLALELYGKIPVIYGSEGISAAAALRWKTQFNENAKTVAFSHIFPELDHNEIMGWQIPEKATHLFELIVLRHLGEHEQISKRIKATLELIKDHIYGATEIWAEGKSPLANLLSLIYIGDFTSIYLALLYEVDPTPVERIRLLKEKLKGG